MFITPTSAPHLTAVDVAYGQFQLTLPGLNLKSGAVAAQAADRVVVCQAVRLAVLEVMLEKLFV
jgi:hypothetical protein